MKKLISVVILILLFQNLSAQNKENISIAFNKESLEAALIKLEDLTNHKFYFQVEWLKGKTVTGNFNNTNLDELLKAILIDTTINFIIYNDSIILTDNSFIINELPQGYFTYKVDNVINGNVNNEDEDEDEEVETPLLQKQYIDKQSSNRKLIIVGKSDGKNNGKSYQISGFVKDISTNKPIQDLIVYVKGQNTNAVTNSEGYYSLKLPADSYELGTKSLGYEDMQQNVVVYGDGTLNFEILESLTQLSEILIESNKDDNIKATMVGITTIDVKEIKTIPLVLGERDVLKVATTMPGVKTAGEGALGYNVRGGKTDQNLILFDNAVMYNPSHFFGIFSAINPFATGGVKIYKGNIPAEFGGRLSSVIDITTKESNTEKFSGEGSLGPVTANMTVEVPIVKSKSSILIGVRATYSDWVLKAIDEESVKKSEASFYDAVIKYNHKINDNNDIHTTFYYSNDKFRITSDSIFKYNNRLASLQWNYKFNDKNRGSIKLVNSQYKFNILYDTNFNTNFDYDYSINETELKFNIKYLHNQKHKFDYGIAGKLYVVEPGEIQPLNSESIIEPNKIEREKAFEGAIYFSDLFEVNDKLSFDLGLRYSFYAALGKGSQNIYDPNQPMSEESIIDTKSYNNNEIIETYGRPEFRLSARYFLSSTLSLKAGYNRTIQYIHLLSSNTTMSPVDTWKLSDLNIEPQKAEQISIGIFKNFSGDMYETSLETYYKKMNDILDFKIGAELSLNENIETELIQGEGKAYGVEFLLKKKKGDLNGWLGYSYSRSLIKLDSEFLTERVNDGDFFPSNYDRPHDFNIVSNYKLTKRYSFSMNFNYQTGRPLTYPIGKFMYNGAEQIIYSDRNQERIPDYFRLDLGINIEGNHKIKKFAHSFWNISVYNVLGRSNPYSVYFVNEQGNTKAYQTSIFAVPIPTITYNFKF